MRRLLLYICALLLVTIVALLLALRSESFVLGAAQWAVGAFTDLRLELRNPRVDFYRGSVSADEIHLMPVSGEGPALLSVLDFSANVPIPMVSQPRQSGTVLSAGAVMVYVSDSDKAAEPKPMQWLGYLAWLPAELRIEQVHLITTSTNTWIFPLKKVRGNRLVDGHYQLTADADYDGEPLGATVDVLAVYKGWGATSAETRIQLLAPASGSEVTLEGVLEGIEEDFRYNFAINAFYRDIGAFFRGFEGRGDLAGELRLQGTMVGDTRGFVLSDATFLLNNTPDYAFQAGGSLTYQWSGASSIELAAIGELASLSYLVDWINLDVGEFGRAQSSIKLSGSLDQPVIDEFRLTTSNDTGLKVSMSGQFNPLEAETESEARTNAILVDIQGPSLTVLQRWLGELPFDPGPWHASGQLTGDQKNLALQDIVLETGAPGSMEIRASGSIGRIAVPLEAGGKYTLSGILVSLRAHVPDSTELNTLLSRQDIPPQHDVVATVSLGGTSEALQLSDGRLSVTTKELQASIGPLSAVLRPAAETPLSDVAAAVLVELSDTAALSRYISQAIPALGPMRISARLAQKGDVFQLLDVIGTIKKGNLTAGTKGLIGNLANLSEVSLTSNISGLDTRTLLSALLPTFSYPAPLADLGGSFKLADHKGIWTVSNLALAAGDERTPLQFAIQGEIGDLTGLAAANLDSQFSLREPDLLAALSGLPLKSVTGTLVIATTPGQVQGTLQAQIGETQLAADTRITTGENRIQGVQLTLVTPHLHLQDFGFEQAREKAPRDATAPQRTTELLAQLREHSPDFPLSLTLEIDGISGDNSSVDSLAVKITGTDKRYTLEQFSASYNRALAEIFGMIDLNPNPPALSLAGKATALPLSDILKDLGVSSNVSGALTILGGITVTGDTNEALVRNLNGSVAFALDNAVIEGAAYDLLATDLLAWIYSGALTEKSTHLDCTMAKFDLRQGVATTESLYIESAKMVATGKAKFDLVKQTMDLRITPLSKSRLLQVPSTVRLKGDISSPKAEISAVTAVADATSAALMLIPSLTLKLFGLNPTSTKSYRPCQADLAK